MDTVIEMPFPGGRVLRIERFENSAQSFDLSYTLFPGIPDDGSAGIYLEAVDNRDAEYLDAGGALITNSDDSTVGTISGQPSVPAGVKWIRVTATILEDGTEHSSEAVIHMAPPRRDGRSGARWAHM